MIWLILIICAFAVDSMGDNKKKRYNKRRSSYNSWYNENSWLDAPLMRGIFPLAKYLMFTT